jgi:hypothetical protein
VRWRSKAALVGGFKIRDGRKFAGIILQNIAENASLQQAGKVPAQKMIPAAQKAGVFGRFPAIKSH